MFYRHETAPGRWANSGFSISSLPMILREGKFVISPECKVGAGFIIHLSSNVAVEGFPGQCGCMMAYNWSNLVSKELVVELERIAVHLGYTKIMTSLAIYQETCKDLLLENEWTIIDTFTNKRTEREVVILTKAL